MFFKIPFSNLLKTLHLLTLLKIFLAVDFIIAGTVFYNLPTHFSKTLIVWVRVVAQATVWRTGFNSLQGLGNFSSPLRPHRLWGPSSSQSNGCCGVFSQLVAWSRPVTSI